MRRQNEAARAADASRASEEATNTRESTRISYRWRHDIFGWHGRQFLVILSGKECDAIRQANPGSNIILLRSTISIENPMSNCLAKSAPLVRRKSLAASFNRLYPK